MEQELTGKKVKGRVRILRANLVHEHMVYIRMIGKDYFEYLVEFNGEIYSNFIIIKPEGKKRKLTEEQIQECSGLIYAGAETTLEALLGMETTDEKTKEHVELFEKNRKKVEGKKDGKKEN